MLGLCRHEPAMPPFLPILGALPFLVLPSSDAAMPAPALVASACVVATTRPIGHHEPPAWLLLAGAVILLGAGRLAAS
jgi:hypothetical protein